MCWALKHNAMQMQMTIECRQIVDSTFIRCQCVRELRPFSMNYSQLKCTYNSWHNSYHFELSTLVIVNSKHSIEMMMLLLHQSRCTKRCVYRFSSFSQSYKLTLNVIWNVANTMHTHLIESNLRNAVEIDHQFWAGQWSAWMNDGIVTTPLSPRQQYFSFCQWPQVKITILISK